MPTARGKLTVRNLRTVEPVNNSYKLEGKMENKEICIELIRILRKIDPLCGNIKMIVNDGNVDDE